MWLEWLHILRFFVCGSCCFLFRLSCWSSRYVLYTTTFGQLWRQGTLGGCNVLSSHRSSWCWAVCHIHDSAGGRGWLASLSGLDQCFYKSYTYAAGRLTKQAGQDIKFRCTDVFLHQLHACILLVVTAMARVSAKDLPGQSSSDQLLLAWDSKQEIISTSPLPSWTVFWITVSTSGLNARTFCGHLFPVNIWSTPPNAHDTGYHFLPSVIWHSQWSSRGSIFHQWVVP